MNEVDAGRDRATPEVALRYSIFHIQCSWVFRADANIAMRGLSPSSNMCSDMRSTRYIEREKDRGTTYIHMLESDRERLRGGEGGGQSYGRERDRRS